VTADFGGYIVDNPFSWDYLTAPISETPTFGPFSIAYLVLFSFVFLASAFLHADAPRRFSDHRLNRDIVQRFTSWMMWASAIALVFLGIRALRTPFLSLEKRIWMYLSFVAFLILVAYIVRYVRTVYPAKLAAFERSRERRAWQHAARRPHLAEARSGNGGRRATATRRRRAAR
jgi:hypothetical protein